MNNSIILTTIQLKLLCTLRNRHKTKSQQSGSDLYLNGKPLTDNLMPPQPDALTARSDLSGLSGKPGSLVVKSLYRATDDPSVSHWFSQSQRSYLLPMDRL